MTDPVVLLAVGLGGLGCFVVGMWVGELRAWWRAYNAMLDWQAQHEAHIAAGRRFDALRVREPDEETVRAN